MPPNPLERIYGTEKFRSLTRKPNLPSPSRFEPTTKRPEDIVI